MAAPASTPLPAQWARRSPLSPFPSLLLHPVPPGCPPPLLLPRRGRGDHVGLGGGGESGPPAQASGAGGRHHWQGQCRPRRQRSAPLPPSRPSLSVLPPALLLRREQPVAAASLLCCRCRDTRRRAAGWPLPHRPGRARLSLRALPRVCAAGPWRRAGRAPAAPRQAEPGASLRGRPYPLRARHQNPPPGLPSPRSPRRALVSRPTYTDLIQFSWAIIKGAANNLITMELPGAAFPSDPRALRTAGWWRAIARLELLAEPRAVLSGWRCPGRAGVGVGHGNPRFPPKRRTGKGAQLSLQALFISAAGLIASWGR